MKTLVRIAAYSLLLAGVAVLSYSEGRQHERDEAALIRTEREFERAAAERGAAGSASFFAEDAVIMREKPVVGPKAIEEAERKFFSTPGNRLEWKPTGAESEHDLGCTVGRYQRTSVDEKGGRTIRHGTYVTAWRRQPDKSWKVIFDGGMADPPPATKP